MKFIIYEIFVNFNRLNEMIGINNNLKQMNNLAVFYIKIKKRNADRGSQVDISLAFPKAVASTNHDSVIFHRPLTVNSLI